MMRILIVVMFTSLASAAHAAGFALNEQSASSLGNALAGGAAATDDASNQFFNPASMAYLPDNQAVFALHAIRPSANFDNDGSHSAANTPTAGGDGGDPGAWAFVPNIYYSRALSDSIKLGLAINAPFGLKTDYEKDWVGRYQAIKSDLRTLNINPSLAFKLNDKFAWGIGVSAMQTKADLTSAIDLVAIAAGASDGNLRVKGDDWGFGWNAGAIFQATDDTRLGLAYRSRVHQTLTGKVKFNNTPGIAAFSNGKVSADLTLPDSLSASVVHRLNSQWDVMADATWTHWSTFDDLTVTRTNGALNGSILSSTPENWRNTMRYAVGTSYQYDDKLKLRAGLAYDETPVTNSTRTPRIPDNDRIALSLGSSYKLSPNSSLDFAYTHLFLRKTSLNKKNDTNVPPLADSVIGDYHIDFDTLSLQYVYMF